MCFDFLYNFCPKYFSLYEEMSKIWSKMYIGLYEKYPLYLTVLMKTELSRQIFENIKISNFVKIRLVGAELVYADGSTDGRTERRTDMTKLTVAFRNFVKAPKSAEFSYQLHKRSISQQRLHTTGLISSFKILSF